MAAAAAVVARSLLISSITLLLFLSLLRPSLSLPSASITEASDVLSNSGFVSMALTLRIISKILTAPDLTSLTIFSPSDNTFAHSGQPPLSHLKYHFCPHSLPLETLQSLPFGSKIPTMNADHSLTVTTSPSTREIEINGVKILGSAIFDDGHLAVFQIENFFDPQFGNQVPSQSPSPSSGPSTSQCLASAKSGEIGIKPNSGGYFKEVDMLLRSTGYSVMASFLGMQLMGSDGQEIAPLTIFAPPDQSMRSLIGNFTDYPSIFLRHVMPCKLSIRELINYSGANRIVTKLDGFEIEVDDIGDSVTLNGVMVTSPDMYQSQWISVHGLGGVLVNGESSVPGTESHPNL